MSQPEPHQVRIFIDASCSYASRLQTGVQRVVRSACQYGKKIDEADVRTVIGRRGGFVELELAEERARFEHLNAFRNNAVAEMPPVYRQAAEAICKQLPAKALRKWLLPQPGRQGAFKLPLKAYESYLKSTANNQRVNPESGDLLILPDAYWAHDQIWPTVKTARRRGAKTAVVLYDLIPLTHPQFVSAKAPIAFKRYLQAVARHADMVVAISDTVRQQVQQLFSTPEYPSTCQHFTSFELGAEFSQSSGPVRSCVKQVFAEDARNTPHLMVATFDPRKNHAYALDAFELLWQKRPDLKLCLLGRVGWLCADILDRIRKHPRFGKQLLVLHDASDAELNYCYERARTVLMPSIVEGFGLPIVEALWHRKHVFASNTPIHREVGQSECHYFDLNSPASLFRQLDNWEASQGEIPAPRASHLRPLTWQESIEGLIETCLGLACPVDSQPDWVGRTAA